MDAVAMAHAARSLKVNQLRGPRPTGDRTVLRVLAAAREQMSGERNRAVYALTALLLLPVNMLWSRGRITGLTDWNSIHRGVRD